MGTHPIFESDFDCLTEEFCFAPKMSKAHPPELKKFMDRKLSIKVNGGRKVEGILRGFDPFMNLVIDDATEYRKDASSHTMGMCVIRGNSVLMIEALERI